MDIIILSHANTKQSYKDLTVNPVRKEGDYLVHQIPEGEQPVHADYGLRIFSAIQGQRSAARDTIHPRYLQFYGISHLYKGRGWYWTPEKGAEIFEPGQAVFTTPGFVQDYDGYKADYVQDYICFCGPLADHLFKSGIITNGLHAFGEARLLLPIIQEVRDPSFTSQIKANRLLQNLLVDLFLKRFEGEASEKYPQVARLLELLRQEPARNWTNLEMAELCNMSLCQFHRVFFRKTGYTPKRYLDMLKIKQSAELLCVDGLSVAEVASRLGYADPFHFSRRFKTMTGISPQSYRRQFG